MNHADMPKLGRDMSYGLLFIVGFLTSFHCVGICGPLIIGYTAKSTANGQKANGALCSARLGRLSPLRLTRRVQSASLPGSF